MKAIWKGEVLAESDETKVIENNHYFPPSSIHKAYFEASDYETTCPWKGKASYYTIHVNGETNESAAWYYPDTKPAASEIQNYVAFWKGVQIVD